MSVLKLQPQCHYLVSALIMILWLPLKGQLTGESTVNNVFDWSWNYFLQISFNLPYSLWSFKKPGYNPCFLLVLNRFTPNIKEQILLSLTNTFLTYKSCLLDKRDPFWTCNQIPFVQKYSHTRFFVFAFSLTVC